MDLANVKLTIVILFKKFICINEKQFVPNTLLNFFKEVAKMIKSSKSTGATLLEIMLVLAVAAMVIVMSIRYYKNANNSQNANALLAQFQAIAAAADSLAQGNQGSYANTSDASLNSILGTTGLTTAYGTITTSNPSATGYKVTTPTLPTTVCATLAAQLLANTKMSSPACAAGILTYTYNSTL